MQPNASDKVRAVMLLPRYILMLVVFAFIGELSYMVFYETTLLMAGSRIMLFDGGALLRGLTVVLPVTMLCSGAMLAVHRVRHSGGGFLSMLVYVLLGIITWYALFPVFLLIIGKIDAAYGGANAQTERVSKLTGGYFREYGRDTVYFPQDFETENMAAVYINGYEEASDAVSIKLISHKQMTDDAAPFRDILIKNTVPGTANWVTEGFVHFMEHAKRAWSRGIISYLAFASLGVALFSVYALSFCSRWRLMGVVIMLSMYLGVLAFNALYASDALASVRAWSLSLPFGGNDVVLMCVNLSIAVLMVLLGALSSLIRARR